jgi:hypothetical protein
MVRRTLFVRAAISIHRFLPQILEHEVEVTLRLTVSQSVNMSWYRAPLWDLRPDIISCRNVAVWNLRSCIYGAPSLTRGRVCNLQCNHSMVRVAHNSKPYFTVSSETPWTWRARFPYLYPPGTGSSSYTPGYWVSGTPSRLLRAKHLGRPNRKHRFYIVVTRRRIVQSITYYSELSRKHKMSLIAIKALISTV